MKRTEQNGQNGQANKKLSPKAAVIASKKVCFLQTLRRNGGNVSDSLKRSGLLRQTAYDHFKSDQVFADAWLDTIETSIDELVAEARRRATVGEPRYRINKGRKEISHYEKSDGLLIFLMKHGMYANKWRSRIIQTGNVALTAVREGAKEAGLTDEQIRHIEKTVLDKFRSIPLN